MISLYVNPFENGSLSKFDKESNLYKPLFWAGLTYYIPPNIDIAVIFHL